MSFGWSNWWGQYWTPGTVDWLIDDWKTEVIRASMGIEPAGAYLSNPTAERAKVIAVVDEAVKRGAYVIIDWHEENAPKHIAQARAFFTDMATRYGSQPNVIYEIYNEPVNYSWSQIKSYAIDIVAAIRAQRPGQPHHRRHAELVIGYRIGSRQPSGRHQHRLHVPFLCGFA